MSNSVRRKTKVETPPIVSKTRRMNRRPIEARLQGHPLWPNFPNSAKKVSNINAGIAKVSTTLRWLGCGRFCLVR